MITPAVIIAAAAETWGSTPEAVLGVSRTARHARARRLAMALMRDVMAFSSPDIGELMHRTGSMARHAWREMEQRLKPSVTRPDWRVEAMLYRTLKLNLAMRMVADLQQAGAPA